MLANILLRYFADLFVLNRREILKWKSSIPVFQLTKREVSVLQLLHKMQKSELDSPALLKEAIDMMAYLGCQSY